MNCLKIGCVQFVSLRKKLLKNSKNVAIFFILLKLKPSCAQDFYFLRSLLLNSFKQICCVTFGDSGLKKNKCCRITSNFDYRYFNIFSETLTVFENSINFMKYLEKYVEEKCDESKNVEST